MIVYGPVPSRRLGRSLGINNIPPKVCTYSCVYCQAGRTTHLQVERSPFFSPDEIAAEVSRRIRELHENGEQIDYLSFVPNGEPTLDANLGQTIKLLKPLGVRIAVITNASLLWSADVREDLAKADWVSLKIDSVREDVWRKLNRPHPTLRLPAVQEGMLAFAGKFRGELVTETMLVKDVNDSEDDLKQIGSFLVKMKPARAYLSVPIRPPAERWVAPPIEGPVNRGFQILLESGAAVDLLVDYEGDAFSSTGDAGEELLSITAVHPMREDAVKAFLIQANQDWQTVQDLIESGRLAEIEYKGNRFYLRKFSE
ncbi:MAG: radical SAM protein, partial [Geobacteraceae bacterium]|nr:radical SAM protein [Geobacteraceae bacterium]